MRLESSDGEQALYRVEIFRSTGEHHEVALRLEGSAVSFTPCARSPESVEEVDEATLKYLHTLAKHVIRQRGPDGRWPLMFQRWRP